MQLSIQRIIIAALATAAASVLLAAMIGAPDRSEAALLERGDGANVVIGKDDDNNLNPDIQPAGTVANQSLNNADVLSSAAGNDVLIGLLGSDVMQGGRGRDIEVGGTEQGSQPNSDIMFGGPDNDTNIWAPGDGSDAFLGADGLDALVFGVIDRDADNVPTLSDPVPGFPKGVPTANVTGSPGFCTVERIDEPNSLNYDFLVRFFAGASGALLVTIRVEDTEQVFCTSQAGGAITFANLTQDKPEFDEVSLAEVRDLNPDVRRIIR
jgi:RTX calcium-binding nonapeptide repeat (4 copies)